MWQPRQQSSLVHDFVYMLSAGKVHDLYALWKKLQVICCHLWRFVMPRLQLSTSLGTKDKVVLSIAVSSQLEVLPGDSVACDEYLEKPCNLKGFFLREAHLRNQILQISWARAYPLYGDCHQIEERCGIELHISVWSVELHGFFQIQACFQWHGYLPTRQWKSKVHVKFILKSCTNFWWLTFLLNTVGITMIMYCGK